MIGWTLFIVQNPSVTREVSHNTWLLVAGILSLVTMMTVLIMFSVFLVREILEVRRQNSFIDSVTHELKSPLASLKLCLETTIRPELTPEQREELRQMMLDDVDRLSIFIDDVLEASRLAHGQSGHPLSDVCLYDLVARCAQSIAQRHKIPPEGISLSIPQDLSLRTDRTSLETIFRNLLDNAVKYSNHPVRVKVQASFPRPGTITVEVQDNGIGIPPRHIKRIFERFYRVPGEEVRSRRGTGLGLFVVSALARNLGGRLEARSKGAGFGASMLLSLPLESARRS